MGRSIFQIFTKKKKTSIAAPVRKNSEKSPERQSLTRFVGALNGQFSQLAGAGTNFSAADPRVQDFQGIIAREIEHREGLKSPGPRRKLAWLRFLSQPDRLAAHLNTLARVASLAGQVIHQRYPGVAVDFHATLNTQAAVYRFSRRGNRCDLDLNEGFLGAPDDVLRAIIETTVSRRSSRRHNLIQAYVNHPEYIRIAAVVAPDPAPKPAETRGVRYDLDDVYQAVNRDQFDGQMPRPRLRWSRVNSTRTLGKYQPHTDTVTISRALDSADTPAAVIRFVMYHELLHKALGARSVNGRQYSHTAEFRDLERRFPAYAEVQEWIRRGVGKIR